MRRTRKHKGTSAARAKSYGAGRGNKAARNMKNTSSKAASKKPLRRRKGEIRFDVRALIRAAGQAVREASREHKRASNPVASIVDGRVPGKLVTHSRKHTKNQVLSPPVALLRYRSHARPGYSVSPPRDDYRQVVWPRWRTIDCSGVSIPQASTPDYQSTPTTWPESPNNGTYHRRAGKWARSTFQPPQFAGKSVKHGSCSRAYAWLRAGMSNRIRSPRRQRRSPGGYCRAE